MSEKMTSQTELTEFKSVPFDKPLYIRMLILLYLMADFCCATKKMRLRES